MNANFSPLDFDFLQTVDEDLDFGLSNESAFSIFLDDHGDDGLDLFDFGFPIDQNIGFIIDNDLELPTQYDGTADVQDTDPAMDMDAPYGAANYIVALSHPFARVQNPQPTSLMNARLDASLTSRGLVTQHPVIKRPYTTAQDWAANKAAIWRLYMVQNLNLQDIMKIMEDRHQFRATVKMYKTQFTKWGWRKYKTEKQARDSRGHSSKKATCLRRSAVRSRALLHESKGTGLVEQALSALCDAFKMDTVMDPIWQNWSKFEVPQATIDLDDDLITALSYLQSNQTTLGGLFLRKVFLKVETALQSPSIYQLYELILEVMCTLIMQRQHHILRLYLSHLQNLLRTEKGPLQRLIDLLCDLVIFDQTLLRHYMTAGSELFADLIDSFRTETDLIVLDARESVLYLKYNLDSPHDYNWTTRRILDQYRQLIREAERENDQAVVFWLQNDFLILQYRLDHYLEDFISLSETQMRMLREIYNNESLLSGCWSLLHVHLYVERLYGLAYYFLDRGSYREVDRLLPSIMEFIKSTRFDGISFFSNWRRLEEVLYEYGLENEAISLGQALENSSQVASTRKMIEDFDKLEVSKDIELA